MFDCLIAFLIERILPIKCFGLLFEWKISAKLGARRFVISRSPYDKKGGIFVVLIFLSDFPNILFWYKGVNDRTRGNKSMHAIIIVY